MNPIFAVLLALGAVALLIWALARQRARIEEDVIEEILVEDDIKPRIQINRHASEDPCQPLDMPDMQSSPDGVDPDQSEMLPCPAIQEAMTKFSDLPAPTAPEIPSVVVITQKPKMTRADALKEANRSRQTEGRLKAQKARDALAKDEDPIKVAADCGYKTVKYMKEKVRELEREGLPA